MDRIGFRNRLEKRGLPENSIRQHMAIVEEFETFISGENLETSIETARIADFLAFSECLIQEGRNTFDNYLALARYANHVNNQPLVRYALEMVDGSEAMKNLYQKIGNIFGEAQRDAVFEGVELPPIGMLAKKKAVLTQTIIDRMEQMLDPITSQELLSSSLRDLPDEDYLEARQKYQGCASIDEFMEGRGADFIAELESIMETGRLYFTQPITREVIDFVQDHPEIKQGVRAGNIIYEVKIPYMAREYLAETDEKMKRYFYCHCPWVRESLRNSHVKVSPLFCNCSAGFHKKFWEVVLNRPLKGWVVESVLKGDAWCKLAIQLPEDVT
jgi:hypothetical protein